MRMMRDLGKKGFQHTAFTFGYESNIVRADVNPSEVSHGALINIVQKGLLYLDIEREVKGIPKVRSHTLTHLQPPGLPTPSIILSPL